MNQLINVYDIRDLKAFTDRERELERASFRLITFNKSDTISSEVGKEMASSLFKLVNAFYNTLDEDEKRGYFQMVSIEGGNGVTKAFEEYSISRSNKKMNEKYKLAFSDKDFCIDVMNQLKIKALEYKYLTNNFIDENVAYEYAKNESFKANRSLMHEVMSRGNKSLIREIEEIVGEKATEEDIADIKAIVEKRTSNMDELLRISTDSEIRQLECNE